MRRGTGRWVELVTLVAVTLTLAGCGSDESAAPGPASQAGTVESVTPEPMQTAEPTREAEDSAVPEDAPGLSGEQAAPTPVDPAPSPSLLPTPTAGPLDLGLDEVFNVEGEWTEDRFNVADRSDLLAMGAPTSCGFSTPSLELRLEQRFETLSFEVGQANSSRNSGETLIVTVIGNGEQIDTRDIKFNQIQEFELDVRNVNALIMEFTFDREECEIGAQVVAVVNDLQVT